VCLLGLVLVRRAVAVRLGEFVIQPLFAQSKSSKANNGVALLLQQQQATRLATFACGCAAAAVVPAIRCTVMHALPCLCVCGFFLLLLTKGERASATTRITTTRTHTQHKSNHKNRHSPNLPSCCSPASLSLLQTHNTHPTSTTSTTTPATPQTMIDDEIIVTRRQWQTRATTQVIILGDSG
jgi:hypothetical protein